MNEISAENVITFFSTSGERETFDFDSLLLRMEQALNASGMQDGELAAEISIAVENAIRIRLKNEPDNILRESDIDDVAVRILENIGQQTAAAFFRKTSGCRRYQIDLGRIKELLAREFPESAGLRELTAKKIYHTLISIGAETASFALISELAKHFLLTTETKSMPPVIHVPVSDTAILSGSMILPELTNDDDTAKKLLRKGTIKPEAIDLRIFPVLRIIIRLSDWASNLSIPVTELALCPEIIRTADAIDAIAIAADKVCLKRGRDMDVPLKLILQFSDADSFARLFMDCTDEQDTRNCIRSLAVLLCGNLSRKPLKILYR